MKDFLVLIHSVYTGDVVRQIVVSANSAEEAIHRVADKIDAAEHGIAIPTGSEPDLSLEAVPEPAEKTVPAEVSSEPVALIPAAEVPTPAEDEHTRILRELSGIPHDVLARVLAAFKGA